MGKDKVRNNGYLDNCPRDDVFDNVDSSSCIERKRLDYAMEQDNIQNIGIIGGYGTGKSSLIISYFLKLRKNKIFWKCRNSLLKVSLLNFDEDEDSQGVTTRILKHLIDQVSSQVIKREKNKIKLYVCIYGFLIFTAIYLLSWGYAMPILKLRLENKVYHEILSFFIISVIVGMTVYKLIGTKKIKAIEIKNYLKIEENTNDHLMIVNNELMNSLFKKINASKGYWTKNIVLIIEDLDRFNEVKVLTFLREINNNLNNCFGRRCKVKFIYAVNSNVFFNLKNDNEDRENSRRAMENTNLSKFFDFTIHIVPTVDTTNSAIVLKELLKKEEGLDFSTLSWLMLEVYDRRMINSIVNEYKASKERLKEEDVDNEKILFYSVLQITKPKLHSNIYKIVESLKDRRNEYVSEKEEEMKDLLEKKREVEARIKDIKFLDTKQIDDKVYQCYVDEVIKEAGLSRRNMVSINVYNIESFMLHIRNKRNLYPLYNEAAVQSAKDKYNELSEEAIKLQKEQMAEEIEKISENIERCRLEIERGLIGVEKGKIFANKDLPYKDEHLINIGIQKGLLMDDFSIYTSISYRSTIDNEFLMGFYKENDPQTLYSTRIDKKEEILHNVIEMNIDVGDRGLNYDLMEFAYEKRDTGIDPQNRYFKRSISSQNFIGKYIQFRKQLSLAIIEEALKANEQKDSLISLILEREDGQVILSNLIEEDKIGFRIGQIDKIDFKNVRKIVGKDLVDCNINNFFALLKINKEDIFRNMSKEFEKLKFLEDDKTEEIIDKLFEVESYNIEEKDFIRLIVGFIITNQIEVNLSEIEFINRHLSEGEAHTQTSELIKNGLIQKTIQSAIYIESLNIEGGREYFENLSDDEVDNYLTSIESLKSEDHEEIVKQIQEYKFSSARRLDIIEKLARQLEMDIDIDDISTFPLDELIVLMANERLTFTMENWNKLKDIAIEDFNMKMRYLGKGMDIYLEYFENQGKLHGESEEIFDEVIKFNIEDEIKVRFIVLSKLEYAKNIDENLLKKVFQSKGVKKEYKLSLFDELLTQSYDELKEIFKVCMSWEKLEKQFGKMHTNFFEGKQPRRVRVDEIDTDILEILVNKGIVKKSGKTFNLSESIWNYK